MKIILYNSIILKWILAVGAIFFSLLHKLCGQQANLVLIALKLERVEILSNLKFKTLPWIAIIYMCYDSF